MTLWYSSSDYTVNCYNGFSQLQVRNELLFFYDHRKAFDSVPHHPLLNKLKSLEVSCHIFRWVADYLTSRSQCVVVEGDKSDVAQVLSGVPQGSVLGPLSSAVLIQTRSVQLLFLLGAARLSMQMLYAYTDRYLPVVILDMSKRMLKLLRCGLQKIS